MKRKKAVLLAGAVATFACGLFFNEPNNLTAALVLLWMGLAE
jgi:hypothetical protein